MARETYLGDSVYAREESGGIAVYLCNGEGEHSHIFFEPETYAALVQFVESLKKEEACPAKE